MTLDTLLLSAKINTSHKTNDKDYLYSLYKKEIIKMNLSSDDYEEAIKKLCDALKY